MTARRIDPQQHAGMRVAVRVFREDPPAAALRSLVALASTPWVTAHVAGMADLHVSTDVCVGTVFATDHALLPATLGGDLGCGVVGQRFALDARSLDRRTLRAVLDELATRVPCGDQAHARRRAPALPEELTRDGLSTRALDRTRAVLGPRHLGTLGGGNHFVELDRDTEGYLWALVHTGSRGLGAAVTAHHRAAAGPAPFAALDARTPQGAAYLADLAWARAFARHNRATILAHVRDVIAKHTGAAPLERADHTEDPPDALPSYVETEHNFVREETHAGRSVFVHRKGAAPAGLGTYTLVPGSMGTATYLVRGLGSPDSLGSCSHGAGRVLSRREAHQTLDPRAVDRALRHIELRADARATVIEEAPQVYRDLRAVLDEQRELIEPVLRLEPLAVLKG